MARNWADLGIEWVMEKVSRRSGENNSDKSEYPNPGPILKVMDVTKFREADPKHDEAILAHLDGQSFRVASQRILRALFKRDPKGAEGAKLEELKERMYGSIVLRSRFALGVVKERVYVLPDGSEFEGDEEVEFRAEYMAQLVDRGFDADTARKVVEALSF